MSYVQIILLVLQFLRSMKKAESAEAFEESAPLGVFGGFLSSGVLKKLWENKEKIISFMLEMIEIFSPKDQTVFGSTAESAEVSSLIEELKA